MSWRRKPEKEAPPPEAGDHGERCQCVICCVICRADRAKVKDGGPSGSAGVGRGVGTSSPNQRARAATRLGRPPA